MKHCETCTCVKRKFTTRFGIDIDRTGGSINRPMTMVFVDALRNAIPENAELTVTDGEFDVNVVINHTTEDTLEWTISQAWNAVYAQLTKERSDAGLSWPDPKWVLPIIRYVERSWQKSAKRTMTERIKFSDA